MGFDVASVMSSMSITSTSFIVVLGPAADLHGTSLVLTVFISSFRLRWTKSMSPTKSGAREERSPSMRRPAAEKVRSLRAAAQARQIL